MLSTITNIAGVVTAVGILAGAAYEVIKIAKRFDRKFDEFQSDWNGTEARPGVPGRAGVMERLSLIEVAQTDTRHRLDEVVKTLENKER